MKVVFWSCMPGVGATTSNMVALASMLALEQNITSNLLQTRYKGNGLQGAFIPAENFANIRRLDDFGIDALLRDYKSGSSTENSISDCGFTFFNGKVTLYTESCAASEDVFLREFTPNVDGLLKQLAISHDITFLDVEAGNSQLTLQALNSADLVVVCLPQSYRILEYFLDKYEVSSIKLFYLFGNYDDKQICNIKSIRNKYKKVITEKNSAEILHCAEFADAINTSSIVKYFTRNVSCKKNDSNYKFISSVRNAYSKILTNLDVKLN